MNKFPKGKKLSVFLDPESVLLMQHLICTGETTSGFLQRMIKECAEAHHLFVDVVVVQK